jgi:hypothetical protein
MLYALKSRNGSRKVANQIIVLPLVQPLLLSIDACLEACNTIIDDSYKWWKRIQNELEERQCDMH